jgi:hypothetical protein
MFGSELSTVYASTRFRKRGDFVPEWQARATLLVEVVHGIGPIPLQATSFNVRVRGKSSWRGLQEPTIGL